MRISLIGNNLINRSAKLLNFCMVGLELSLFCISPQTGKSTEAFDSQMALITDKIAEAVTKVKLKAITVAGFTDLHDKESDLGLFLADQVSAGLVQKGCEVVDRKNVARILAEHQLTASGLVDPENAKKLGQFAGLDAIVIGTITPLSGTIRVTVKVLATDSAKLLAAASADLPKTNSIRAVMGEPEIAEPTPTPQMQRTEAPVEQPIPPRKATDGPAQASLQTTSPFAGARNASSRFASDLLQKESIKNFIENHLKSVENRQLDVYMSAYDEYVNWYRQGRIPSSKIRQEMKSYFNKWDTITYNTTGLLRIEVRPDLPRARASYPIALELSNQQPVRHRNPQGIETVELEIVDGALKIVSENQQMQ
jgi:TolB-like protein